MLKRVKRILKSGNTSERTTDSEILNFLDQELAKACLSIKLQKMVAEQKLLNLEMLKNIDRQVILFKAELSQAIALVDQSKKTHYYPWFTSKVHLEFSKITDYKEILAKFSAETQVQYLEELEKSKESIEREVVDQIIEESPSASLKPPSKKYSPLILNIDKPIPAKLPATTELKSLMANERTFLSWLNVSLGVATLGVYKNQLLALLGGVAFLWLSLIIFVLRKNAILQEKNGKIFSSVWFTFLFSIFILTILSTNS